jgi:hypothetical protein
LAGPINLQIGSEMFAGMLAPDEVAQKLLRVAVTRQIRSAGRKPVTTEGDDDCTRSCLNEPSNLDLYADLNNLSYGNAKIRRRALCVALHE